ncbi:hypothetical protein PTMSG1_10082 [Pyrenophora teres f. maculata]|nr:hypothetical protein PTMSG1_10082 [Pyrenophora teres f. maculata]
MQPKLPVKASVLLKGDDLRHFKDFRYWRSCCNPAVLDIRDEYMTLPTAYEYYEFRNHCANTHLAKETGVAGQCRHPLHPGHPAAKSQKPEVDRANQSPKEVAQWCPLCTVKIHLGLLDALYKQWEAVGGPWHNPDSPPRTPARHEAMRAYTVRKKDFANELLKLEDISQAEKEWENANSSISTSVEAPQKYSATKALDAYAKIVKFPGMAPAPEPISSITPFPSPGQPKKKKLSFSPDVPQETRHRPCAHYFRNCPSVYDPHSPHACPSKEGWAETSFQNDLHYNLCQCRLLLCDRNPSSHGEVTYRELHDDASKDLLVALVEEWLENLDNQAEKQYWTRNLTATTDLFAVWKEDDVTGEELFSDWIRLEVLEGSNLEAYARAIGDLNESDDEEGSEEFFDQESVASDSEHGNEGEGEDVKVEEQEEKAGVRKRKRKRGGNVDIWSDPMDLDDDVNGRSEIVGLVGGQDPTNQLSHWIDEHSKQ